MIKSFEEVMEVTGPISSHAAFELPECRAYYDLLCSLPQYANVLEIGLQFGRSSSIVAQVAEEKRFRYYGIDPWTDPPDARSAWLQLMMKFDVNFTLFAEKTQFAQHTPNFPSYLHMALIDGDHNAGGVQTDCDVVLPRMIRGGYVCFHDYGRESLPDVYPTVKASMVAQIMAGRGFTELPTVGTLGIWQRC